MLTLAPAVVEAIAAHASAGYPAETCGLLFGPRAGSACLRMAVIPNEADRYHALDPVAHPRTARSYFLMNGAKVARQVREAEAAGEDWLGIWHSHIDCGAYFSSEDAQTFAPEGVPTYPALFQVVVDVRGHAVIEARAFRWDGACFAPVATFPEFRRRR